MADIDNHDVPTSGERAIERRITWIAIAVLLGVCACLTGVSELLI